MAQAGSLVLLLVGASLFGVATRVAFPPAAWIGLAALVHASRSMSYRTRSPASLVGAVRLAWDRQARHVARSWSDLPGHSCGRSHNRDAPVRRRSNRVTEIRWRCCDAGFSDGARDGRVPPIAFHARCQLGFDRVLAIRIHAADAGGGGRGHLGHYVRRRLVCVDIRIGLEPRFQLDGDPRFRADLRRRPLGDPAAPAASG